MEKLFHEEYVEVSCDLQHLWHDKADQHTDKQKIKNTKKKKVDPKDVGVRLNHS